jgi:hypothetical protein
MPEPSNELKKKDSGPIVVKFESQKQISLHNQDMSNIVRPAPRRGRKLIILGVCGLGFASYRSFIENYDEIPEVSSILRKSETSDKRAKSAFSLFDINGPPPSSETIGGKSSRQIKNAAKNSKKGKTKKSDLKTFPFIFDNANDDDEVPRAAAGAVQTAAEALLCPDSVVDYVINATDLKDECDGLRKVFSKYCADTEGPSMQDGDRRRLSEYNQETIHAETNPVIVWQFRLRYVVQSVQQWWRPVDYYDSVAMNQRFESSPFSDTVFDQSHRRLAEENAVGKQFLKDDSSAEAKKGGRSMEKSQASIKDRPKMSLDLPIKGRLSQKALSESLLLHQDDKAVFASVKAAQNSTNTTEKAAATDATASLKAVSDANKLVSSVLNDPTSVEARACCTSVLSVYHEICSVDEEDALSDKQLFIVVAVIVVCGLVKSLIRHFQIRWLPEAAGCVLVGGK